MSLPLCVLDCRACAGRYTQRRCLYLYVLWIAVHLWADVHKEGVFTFKYFGLPCMCGQIYTKKVSFPSSALKPHLYVRSEIRKQVLCLRLAHICVFNPLLIKLLFLTFFLCFFKCEKGNF